MWPRHLALSRPLGPFIKGVAWRICLTGFSLDIPYTWTNQLIEISLFGEVIWHSRLYEFHSWALCREVSRRERSAKIPSLPLALEIVLFQSFEKLHDNKWRSAHRSIQPLAALQCLKASVVSLWSSGSQPGFREWLPGFFRNRPKLPGTKFANTVLWLCSNIDIWINPWGYIFFVVWASSSIHCLAAVDLGAGVEQSFDCLIVQNRQAMQSMRRSMDWTLKNNMVDGLFFCATLTDRKGGHTPFVQTGAETPDTGAEAVKSDPRWVTPEGWVPVSGMKVWSFVGCPTTPHSVDNPPTASHVCCCFQMNMMSCCATGINGCLDLRCRPFPLDGRVSAEWSRCPGSMARRAKDSVAPLRRSSAGWMLARIERLSAGVGHKHPVTFDKASLMSGSMRRVWALWYPYGGAVLICRMDSGQGWIPQPALQCWISKQHPESIVCLPQPVCALFLWATWCSSFQSPANGKIAVYAWLSNLQVEAPFVVLIHLRRCVAGAASNCG